MAQHRIQVSSLNVVLHIHGFIGTAGSVHNHCIHIATIDRRLFRSITVTILYTALQRIIFCVKK